jgi:hypothetical protein
MRVVILLALVLSPLGACDTGSSSGSGAGPTTTCLYGHTAEAGAVDDFGAGCTDDADCAYGVCLMPGDKGNITNAVFGFCTRACDCDCEFGTECGQSVSGSDPQWSCVYPGGCWPGESQGRWRHVAPKCTSVADCQAIDSRYTHCGETWKGNALQDDDKTCGQDHKVCQAY